MQFKLTEEEVASMVRFALENGGAPFQMEEPVISDMKFHSGQSQYLMTLDVTPQKVLDEFDSSEGGGEE